MSGFSCGLHLHHLLARNPTRLLQLFLWILVVLVIAVLLYTDPKFPSKYRSLHDSDDATVEGSPRGCVRPQLQLWHPSMKVHFKVPPPLHCGPPQDWIFVRHGKVRIAADLTDKFGDVLCECTPIIRINQTSMIRGDSVKPCVDGQDIPADAFEVKCVSKFGDVYKNIHLGVKAKPDAMNRPKSEHHNSMGLNILMVGFDTVSKLNWIRNLPKSYAYFTSVLGGTTLEGYNIVGDGTPQALLPILTGKTEEELPEARRGFDGATFVDKHPWIWRDLKNIGYVTQYGEDDTIVGTFEYRMMGFKEQPVDHFLRPYRYIVQHQYGAKFCLGSEPLLDTMLNWIKELYFSYAVTPKFTFLFHSEYSHGSFYNISLADETLLNFLTDMKVSGHLDNTLLILMSDHGARFAEYRNSQQGKYEERLPYMGLRLPEWFSKKYPQALDNLRSNAETLTSPFDIHATFTDVINYEDKGVLTEMKRGMSLFQAIPKNRTCSDAGIAPHWCTCMDWTETSVNDHHVISAANELLSTINAIIYDHNKLCAKLTFDQVQTAMIFSPKIKLLKFDGSLDKHGRQPKMTHKMLPTQELYQITISVKPSGALYEATVTHDQTEQKYVVSTKAISRLNKYGSQPHCVMDTLPHLRPYCYCLVQ